MSNKIQLTPENIQQVITDPNPEKVLLLTFYSNQNPECVQQDQILEGITAAYSEHITIGVIDCDVQQALASQLAQQIGLQALPTIVILKGGAPVDMLAGAKTEEEIKEALSEHLPSPEVILLDQAKQFLASGELNNAFSYAKKAYDIDSSNTRVKLVFADICMQIQKFDEAQALLDSVNEEQRDPYYHNLVAKLAQAAAAQDSPEVKRLELAVEAEPDSLDLRCQLAQAQLDVGKKEEALASLLTVLKKDMNYGEAKRGFLDIIASLPDGDSVASAYRRKLYSLLY
ncbi:tetratricopeptide repeat protein [Pseudoalteromonas piscicida]|uniref:Thioredoxin n=1 Tax=Pseudoalteromonas piscicida TaxID=43662 RepID=A0ABM6N9W0_PSEO7|nr:tetratricopeptide repeat protein [Pseudoalteromonas piscicida]ATD05578.1 putative thioredoxin [Pseudoalteromonas piscicida]WPU32367.1 tetratricopeptide repeat protein [Pseudoalteromonas piscicida]